MPPRDLILAAVAGLRGDPDNPVELSRAVEAIAAWLEHAVSGKRLDARAHRVAGRLLGVPDEVLAEPEIPAARLVVTWSRRIWHISRPGGLYTLCQAVTSVSRRKDGPIVADVCRRCLRTYEKEAGDGR